MGDKPSTDIKQTPRATSSAASNSSIGRNEESSERPKKARRTFLTQNACTRCRQKKSKCDGKRPVCGRCEKHRAECVYDVAQEGITRMQNLQQQLENSREENAKLSNFVLALQRGTDHDATALLARLRLGASIDDLLAFVGALPLASSGCVRLHMVANQLHPELSLRATPLIRSSIGNDPSPPEIQQSPYLDSWPGSPLQDGEDGSWIPWSARCAPGRRTMSQSSESRTDPRLTMSIPPPNPTLTMSDGFHQNDPRDGYAPGMPDGFTGQGQNIPFGSFQWQNPFSQEDNDSMSPPGMNISPGPYYVDPSQPQMQRGHGSQRQRGTMQQSPSQDRRFSQ